MSPTSSSWDASLAALFLGSSSSLMYVLLPLLLLPSRLVPALVKLMKFMEAPEVSPPSRGFLSLGWLKPK